MEMNGPRSQTILSELHKASRNELKRWRNGCWWNKLDSGATEGFHATHFLYYSQTHENFFQNFQKIHSQPLIKKSIKKPNEETIK